MRKELASKDLPESVIEALVDEEEEEVEADEEELTEDDDEIVAEADESAE